ncbi:MAG: translocation/assembly module TamB domain-containing protein, partial [Candidatus Aminicenantes bacterium]|nr:translocation/assembly module TamB domain-containing protein [Candidatus Aminicenantes bacterium]
MALRKLPRVLKIFFVFFLGVFLLIFLLLLFFSSPPGEKLALQKTSSLLLARTGLKLQAEKFKLNLFKLKAELKAVNLQSSANSSLPLESFFCDSLTAQAGWSLLIGEKIHVKNLEINNPRLKLKPASSVPAQMRVASPPGRARKASAFNLQVDRLQLTGGQLSYEDKAVPLEAELRNLEFYVNFRPEKNYHDLRLSSGPWHLAFQNKSFVFKQFQLEGGFDQEKLEIHRCQLTSDKTVFNLKLNVQDYLEKPRGEVLAAGRLSFPEIAGWLFPETAVAGFLEFDLKASSSSIENPRLSGTITGSQILVADWPAVDFTLSLDTASTGDYQIKGEIKSEPGKINLQASFSPRFSGPFRADVQLGNLSLKTLSPLIPGLPLAISSTVLGQIRIKGPGFNPETLEGEAEIKIRPLENQVLSSGLLLPLASDLRASYQSGRVEISRLNLQTLGVEASLSGRMERKGEISGRASVKMKNLTDFQRQLEKSGLGKIIPGWEEKSALIKELKGQVELDALVSGSTASPRLNLEINGQQLRLAGVEFPVLKGKFSLNPGTFKLQEFLLKLEEGQVEAFGQLFRINQAANIFKIASNIKFVGVELSKLAAVLPEKNREYLNGKFNAAISLNGTNQKPQVRYQVALTGLRAGSLVLESLSFAGEYRDKRISLDNLFLKLPESQLAGQLAYDLNTDYLNLALKAGSLKLAQFQSWLPELKAGQVDFELDASGPVKKLMGKISLSGQGLMYDRFWFPYLEFRAKSDGEIANFNLEVPRFNLNLEARLMLESPHLLNGQLRILELPLSALAGILPLVEETPAGTSLSARADFEVPLLNRNSLRAEFHVSNFDFEGLASLWPSLQSMAPSGSADFYLKMKGWPGTPESFLLVAEIPALQLVINELPIRNELPLRVSLEGNLLKAENLSLLLGESRVRFFGQVNLMDKNDPGLNLQGRAELNLSDFNSWLPGMKAGGFGLADLKITGTVNKPELQGSLTLDRLFLRLQDLPVVISDTRALVSLKGQELKLEKLEGLANAGKFTGYGQALLGAAFSLDQAIMNFRLNNFDFNYQGLNTFSEAVLSLSREKRGWWLKGNLNLLRASYREDFYPSLDGLKIAFARVSPAGSEIPAFLHEVALDVNVKTLENIIIKNNLADLEMRLDLNIKGTVPAPIILGRVENAYPGQIMVSERKYTVERLRADFLGKENLEPFLDIYLTSTVYDEDEEIDVSLILNGPVSDLQFSLNSNPSRSPEDLASLLLTGKSFKQVQGSAINTITGQLMQQFSSPLTSPVTRTLKKLLKAEDVVLEPLNIATLQDPGARLTVRKSMAPGVAVTYSVDLANSQRQAWIVDYNWKHNLSVRGFRRDDGEYGASFRHRFSVGPQRPQQELTAESDKRLIGIFIEGETVYPVERLNRVLRLKTGKKFKNAEVSRALDRLNSWYFKNGYLNAQVSWQAEDADTQAIRLRIDIKAGPKAEIRFSGDKLSRKIRKKALNSWVSRLPEEANLEQLRYVVESELNKLGYYKNSVQAFKKEQNNQVIYLVEVKKGARWKIADFKLEGQPVFKASLVKRVISDYFGAKAKGLWNLVYDQKVALDLIDYFYQENGYLQVKIDRPLIKEDGNRKQLHLSLKIEAGPQSRVREVKIEGQEKLSRAELISLLSLKPGEVFSWPALAMDRTALLNRYRSLGFKEAQVVADARPVENKVDYDVIFKIEEGHNFNIAEVELAGARRSKKSFLLKTSGLTTGQPASLEFLARAQKNLYDSGAFQSVNITSVPISGTSEKAVVKVQEKPWLTVNYGLQYNTETRLEGFVETDFNNLFGYGWNGLIYLRANKRQQDARFSLKIPYLFSRKTDLIASVFYLKDSKEFYITEQLGTSLQQKISVVKGFNLSWVYKLSRIHDYEKVPSWPFPYDVKIFTSELSLLLNRDTRDDKFDPKKGMLLTGNFSYSPKFLGSDLSYISTFTQASFYKALFSGITWASCYRLGLASAFGEYLIPSKRFYAGGGTSIRGFKLDAVGPIDFWTGLPEGGEAVLVVNQELRFPIYKIVRGVAFFDAGNVYYQLRDFNPVKLRTGAGLGLRIESPLGLLRLDYGLNLKPRPGESKTAIFFS